MAADGIGDLVDGRYRILKPLGEGGMGTVFLAEHTLIKRRVALKLLHSQLATDANVVECFMNEARAAGTLGHPNIVESTDMGFTAGHVPYIVFEYLEGMLLTDEIYRVGGLPVRRAVWIAQQIAQALRAAHDAGIIHRDLKSDNVFLTDKDDALDHVKVLDFGISHFMDGQDRPKRLVMGTPEFMAPEQLTAPETVDHRTDIYALGVILYEMLAARRPFTPGEHPDDLPRRIVNRPPAPLRQPNVPHALGELVVDRMLAKDPGHRPQSMGAVLAALEAFLTREDGTPVPRRTSAQDTARGSRPISPANVINTPWPPASQPVRVAGLPTAPPAKRPYALYTIAAGGLVIGALGLMLATRGGSQEPAPAPAPRPAVATPAPKAPAKVNVVLTADAPNAHVVFRRRVAATPMHLDIEATNIVELVEISAPGYRTQRFWLTLDRATHLAAHLSKGSGATEATEEETLVALGEAPQPVVHEVVAAVAAPAHPVVERHVVERTVAPKPVVRADPRAAELPLAPRRIGKANVASDVSVSIETPAAAPAPVQTEPSVTAVEPPPPPPAPAPPAPVATPAVAVAAAPAKPDPAKQIAPGVMKKLRLGSETQVDVPYVVQRQMARDEHKKASAVVKVCIAPGGDVTSAAVIKSSGYSGYDDALVGAARTWRYKGYVLDGKAVAACSALSFTYAVE